LLTKLGAHVVFAGPRTLMPLGLENRIAPSEGSVTFAGHIEEAIADADVVMMLRSQLERQAGGFFPSLREYSIHTGLNRRRMQLAKSDAIVMHPGPINRGIEIDSDVADGPFSMILDQVSSGVAIRMAVLYLLAGANENGDKKKVRKKREGGFFFVFFIIFFCFVLFSTIFLFIQAFLNPHK